jgi:divalent metal cation (Fe/Co/Zn/Cd) transporter
VLGAANLLTDAALVDVDEIVRVCSSVEGVIDCHAVRSRGGAGRIRVDLHIHVAPDLPVRRAHEVAAQVEAAIKQHVPGVAEVLVHIGAAGGSV